MLHQRKRKKSKGAKICNSAKNFLEKCKPKEDS